MSEKKNLYSKAENAKIIVKLYISCSKIPVWLQKTVCLQSSQKSAIYTLNCSLGQVALRRLVIRPEKHTSRYGKQRYLR